MAINFPNSPNNGDTHTAAGITYVYDSTVGVWKRQGSSGIFEPSNVTEDIIPATNEQIDLGSSTKKFKDLHLSGTTLNLGSQTLSADASGIIVPELTIGTGTNKVKLAAKTDGTLETTGTNDSGNQAAAATYATETFVTTQVNNLVDAAPGALDTLNELAAALGDDANFSTTGR